MRFTTKLIRTLPLLVTLSLIVTMIACQTEMPMTAEQPVASTTSQVTILKVKDDSGGDLKKAFAAKALIDDDGGRITIGSTIEGYSYIDFPEDAIDEDDYDDGVLVYFYWESESLLQADFYPEGLTFDKPVHIRLSYKNANLKNVNEDDLGIYYYNPLNGNWELVSNQVNTTDKYVDGYIDHFSRYAIGME